MSTAVHQNIPSVDTRNEESLALLDSTLGDWKTEAERQTLEELRVLMRRNLPVYLKRWARNTKKARPSPTDQVRDVIRQTMCERLTADRGGAARFCIRLIVLLCYKV